jgi:hypothetical protein
MSFKWMPRTSASNPSPKPLAIIKSEFFSLLDKYSRNAQIICGNSWKIHIYLNDKTRSIWKWKGQSKDKVGEVRVWGKLKTTMGFLIFHFGPLTSVIFQSFHFAQWNLFSVHILNDIAPRRIPIRFCFTADIGPLVKALKTKNQEEPSIVQRLAQRIPMFPMR